MDEVNQIEISQLKEENARLRLALSASKGLFRTLAYLWNEGDESRSVGVVADWDTVDGYASMEGNYYDHAEFIPQDKAQAFIYKG
jgi:hypothetical protein